MSLEVEFTTEEYSTLLDWYVKAFGSKNDAEINDKKLESKIAVMAEQHIRNLVFIERQLGEK